MLGGKVAVITGGATGIGLATAKKFVAEGAHVFIFGRRRTELDAAVTAIGRHVKEPIDAVRAQDDRIREAAYALIPEGERTMVHFRIARLLVAATAAENLEEKIFDIVNQFGRGAVLITTHEEREQVAWLYLVAGRHAGVATAYDAALQYFTACHALLGETGWERCYRLNV